MFKVTFQFEVTIFHLNLFKCNAALQQMFWHLRTFSELNSSIYKGYINCSMCVKGQLSKWMMGLKMHLCK